MDVYSQLLDATITHLEALKDKGVRHLAISGETLRGLSSPGIAPKPARSNPLPTFESAREVQPAPTPASTPVPAPAPPKLEAVPRVIEQTSPVVVRSLEAPGDKAKVLEELRERALVCQKCPHLASSRKKVVWGVGSIDANLMFIGEAPGAEEDEQGEPFVGRAGQLLTRIIQTMGLSRETVYIANILKCRPDTPSQAYGNRPPTAKEMENCLPYLHAQIDLIKPKAIVALGATAVEGLFGKVPGMGITRIRGKWREYRGIPVMPTYHPSYLLRPNPNNVKREVWEDMLQVMERLEIPISEKQRGYFLKNS